MNIDWQIIVVAACIAWAVGVLVRRGYRLFREPSATSCGSGGCHDCPSNSTKESTGLIQLQMPVKNQVAK